MRNILLSLIFLSPLAFAEDTNIACSSSGYEESGFNNEIIDRKDHSGETDYFRINNNAFFASLELGGNTESMLAFRASVDDEWTYLNPTIQTIISTQSISISIDAPELARGNKDGFTPISWKNKININRLTGEYSVERRSLSSKEGYTFFFNLYLNGSCKKYDPDEAKF